MHTKPSPKLAETVDDIIATRSSRSIRNELKLVEITLNHTLDQLTKGMEKTLRIKPNPGTSLVNAVRYTSLETLIAIINQGI